MYNTGYEFIGWEALLQVWLPKIIGAVLILIAAWIIGRVLKWALAKGVDRIPGMSNASANPKHSVGQSLGDVALWLVLLFGVIAALGVLGLGQVVSPLNTLLTQVAGFLPNIIGASLILFIGFVVATLARRVTEAALRAANADSWMDHSGLAGKTGSTGLSSALGTLVFVLILIPITIAALEQLSIDSLTIPAVAVLTTVFDAIPRVLVAALLLAIGWFIGRWVCQIIERILPATGFDRSIGALAGLQRGQVDPAATTTAIAGSATPSRIVGIVAMAAIVAFTAIEAMRILSFDVAAQLIQDVLSLAVQIMAGGVIIVAGVIIGNLLASLINRGTAGSGGFVSTIARWAAIALATAMGLSFMGIADNIVMLAFGLILGSAAVAAALAFGLGGRDAAGRVSETWADKVTTKPGKLKSTPMP